MTNDEIFWAVYSNGRIARTMTFDFPVVCDTKTRAESRAREYINSEVRPVKIQPYEGPIDYKYTKTEFKKG